jgi:hypothetical protein
VRIKGARQAEEKQRPFTWSVMLFALRMFLPFLAESAAEPRLLSGVFG